MEVDVQGNDKLSMKLIWLKCMLDPHYLEIRISHHHHSFMDTVKIRINLTIITEINKISFDKCSNMNIQLFRIKLD